MIAWRLRATALLILILAAVILAAGGCGGGSSGGSGGDDGKGTDNSPTEEEITYSTGVLDESFGTGGKVSTPVGTGNDLARAVAVQDDGKIVAAGSTIADNAWSDENFALVRYNTDGSLDITFGGDGTVVTSFRSGSDRADAMAIQKDGKIVVAGSSERESESEEELEVYHDIAVVRYNTDGTLDATFGTGGKVITPVGPRSVFANAIALQQDGKIVVAAEAFNGTDFDFAVVRYNTDGTLDTSFDGDGKVMTAVGSSDDSLMGIAVQEDGKIVAAGSADTEEGMAFAVVRYNADGSLDGTFGSDGIVTTKTEAPVRDIGYDVAVRKDGKIVVAGFSDHMMFVMEGLPASVAVVDTNPSYVLVCYESDGTLDDTFGSAGIATTPVTSNHFYTGVAFGLQGDGKALIAGALWNGSDLDFALMRYNSDGTPDVTFGSDGVVLTPVGASDDTARAIAIMKDGRIVAAGHSMNGNIDFAVALYK